MRLDHGTEHFSQANAPPLGIPDIAGIARQYFGHESLRKGQEEVVTALLSGRDAVVLWATGQGKSMCFQLPALANRGTVFVVSPLISLMTDQACA